MNNDLPRDNKKIIDIFRKHNSAFAKNWKINCMLHYVYQMNDLGSFLNKENMDRYSYNSLSIEGIPNYIIDDVSNFLFGLQTNVKV